MAAIRSVVGTIVLAVVLPIGLAGCTQPDPLGQPTYACTPDDGTSPYPCYKTQHDQKIKEDALYTEAETVYRKFFAEQERIYRTGGVTQPTPVLLETTTGNYLAGSMVIFAQAAKYKGTASGGEFKLAWMKHAPTQGRAGVVTALQSCTDASSVTMGAEGEPSAPGKVSSEVVYFTRIGDTLKASDFDLVKVTQC